MLDPIIKEGQRLERLLQVQMGETVKKAITFELGGEKIVDAGDKVASKHLTLIQKTVHKKLEALENELKDKRQAAIDDLKTKAASVKAQADQEMEALRNQLESQTSVSSNNSSRLRGELLELRPFTFISEIRYRELKQRWGQVFRADMGAEAFYDVLERLDLDKLSEELWHEVRTTKSKEKRKKATTRLKVSKMPGRTQHLNYFRVGEERYLVDLPGYGYARAPIAQKHTWQDLIGGYLHNRPQLRGLVLIMDIRHPFTDLDMQLLHWFQGSDKPVHILLSKADKLSRSQASAVLHQVRKVLTDEGIIGSAQLFSSSKQLGLEEAEAVLRSWLDLPKATNSEAKTEKPKKDQLGKKKPGSRGIKAGRTEP